MKSLNLRIENEFAIIEFDQPESKANILSAQSLLELGEIISQLEKRKDLEGACILSKKADIFIAGADIKEIESITSASQAQVMAQAGQKILSRLEELPMPTIALINGACLGGGLELALACDWRLASFGDKVKIGLLDGLENQQRLLDGGIEFLKKNPRKRLCYRPKTKGIVNKFLEQTFIGRAIFKKQAKKFILKTTKGHYPAPLKALEVVAENYASGLEKALEGEAAAFGELAIGLICKNLISVFYLIEKYKKKNGLKPRRVKSINAQL